MIIVEIKNSYVDYIEMKLCDKYASDIYEDIREDIRMHCNITN